MPPSPQEILSTYWHYESFRPLQLDIIQSILTRRDTLALLPTGGGKSICFQVPGIAMDGMCLVVSPLIALMKDQVEGLRKKGITAYAVFSGMARKEVMNIFQTAADSNCKFLYVSPERLQTAMFKEFLPGFGINMIAVDEAHCISQWGYDFRPQYLEIAKTREELPGVPVLALSASATPVVQKDICEKLQFRNHQIFQQPFARPNLSYSVFHGVPKVNKLVEIINNVPGSGIVYCKSRRRTEDISSLLQMHNMSSSFYHAGLSADERNARQDAWIKNEVRVIACTNAFGMGIDKPDVRTVVHIDIPDSLEHYYQEAGRAGRDLKKSYAVLLSDDAQLKALPLQAEVRYPALENIRIVYRAIVNYLQAPTGEIEKMYDFEMDVFIKKFKLDAQLVYYAIKALEQDGWVSVTESFYKPSTVAFTSNKFNLEQFEQTNPEFEPLIKTLLRQYEGIFDQPANIQEASIAALLKIHPDEIINQLVQLHNKRVIEYKQRTSIPQLQFLKSRVAAEDLMIDTLAMEQRKKAFLERTGAMISFVINTTNCRSAFISSYFGDMSVKDCGVCDNCMKRRKSVITETDFENIRSSVMNALKQQSLNTGQLLIELKKYNKEKAWRVIDYLQAEGKITIDQSGKINLS